jgi:hypothetical protein
MKKVSCFHSDGHTVERSTVKYQIGNTIWVDQEQISDRADGSNLTPFPTIRAALDLIISRGDNRPDNPYRIMVAPGRYPEGLILDSQEFRSLTIIGVGHLGNAVWLGGPLMCLRNNCGFESLIIQNIQIPDIEVVGAVNQSLSFEKGVCFWSCTLGNVVLRNLVTAEIADCQVIGDIILENINNLVSIIGNPGQFIAHKLEIHYDSTKPRPMGEARTVVALDNTITGTLHTYAIGGKTYVQLRKGARVGPSNGKHHIGVDTAVDACDAYFRGDIRNEGVFKLKGGSAVSGKISGNRPEQELTLPVTEDGNCRPGCAAVWESDGETYLVYCTNTGRLMRVKLD